MGPLPLITTTNDKGANKGSREKGGRRRASAGPTPPTVPASPSFRQRGRRMRPDLQRQISGNLSARSLSGAGPPSLGWP
jgi:hypothetical protein